MAEGAWGRRVGWTLVALALALLFTSKLVKLLDIDIFLHLAVGDWILEHRAVPRTGLFSATRGGAPWVDNEWGSQVLLAAVFRAWGVKGLVLLSAFLATLAAAILGVALRKRGVSLVGVALAIALTGWALGFVNLRPQLVTSVFLCIFLLGLADFMGGRPRAPLIYLPLATLLWANMHGGFILGWVLLAIPIAVEGARRAAGRPAELPLPALAWTLGLCVLASFLNPYGWRQVVYPIEYALRPAMTSFNTEWQPVVLADVPGFGVLLAAAVTVLALSPRRPTLHDLALLLSFLGFGMKAWRHLGLMAFVIPFAVAPCAAAALAAAFPEQTQRGRVLLPALVLVLLIGGFFAVGGLPADSPFHYDPDVVLPVETAEFFAAHRPPGLLFHDYAWGGYLAYRFKPAAVVFVDGRNDLYREDFMAEYLGALTGGPGCLETLDRYGVNSAMLAYNAVSARLIGKLLDAGWVCVQAARGKIPVVLLVRNTEHTRPLIQQYGGNLARP